jgi:hypothetical protein
MKKLAGGRVGRIAIIAMLALTFGACSAPSRAPNDQQIVSSIDAKLYQDPDLKTLSINVASKQGVVTLSGTVNAPVEKLAVEDLARKTDDVKQVVDNLAVASASSEAAASAPSSDQANANTPRHHKSGQSGTYAATENQTAPAAHEPQSAAPPTSDSSGQAQASPQQPAPDSSLQAQPGGPGASAPATAAAPAPPPPERVTIPAGTLVQVRMIDSVSSDTAQPGEVYKASLSDPVMVDGQVVIPRDATARVRVVDAQSAGHFQGQPLLKLELIGFTVNGTRYSARSDYYTRLGPSRGKNTAAKVGGGAAVGALLGAIIGHGRGAGIGTIIGAGAGTVDQKVSHPKEITIPSETIIDFTLKHPVGVTLSGGGEGQ